jgi:hypothetical protein
MVVLNALDGRQETDHTFERMDIWLQMAPLFSKLLQYVPDSSEYHLEILYFQPHLLLPTLPRSISHVQLQYLR